METTKQNEANSNAPKGTAHSRHAFLRDLPTLLADPTYDRWYVAYCGDERIGFAESEIELLHECQQRGLRPDQYFIGAITSRSDDEAIEEIKGALSFVEYDDDLGTFSGPAFDDVRVTP